MNKLTKRTERWLLAVAPPHIASMDSPNTYEDVRKYHEENGVFHVFAGGSTDTIFSSREVQYAYRAWHDSIHMKYEIPFGMQSELAVARLQESIALDAHVDPKDARLLRLDLEAHIEYYYASGENHPDRQLEMIADVFKFGMKWVMKKVKDGQLRYH